MITKDRIKNLFGEYLFFQQLAIMAFIGVLLIQALFLQDQPYCTTGGVWPSQCFYFGPISGLWQGLHALDLFQLLLVALLIRLMLPHTIKGFVYSMLGALFLPLSGESIFVPPYWVYYNLQRTGYPLAGDFWMISRTGVISLWLIVLSTRTHKMFNWKILAAGVLVLVPVMMVWYYPYNFILWNWATDATGQLIGHAFTVIYYTIWCVALAAAFKGEMP